MGLDLSLPAALGAVAFGFCALWLIFEAAETWWWSRCPWRIEPDSIEDGWIWTKKS